MTTQRHIAIGDTVIYVFTTSRGDTLSRPAIITSIMPDDRHIGPARAVPIRRVNLHVFFEFADVEMIKTPVSSSMGVRLENILQPTDPPFRSNVPERAFGIPPSEAPGWTLRADPARGVGGMGWTA